MRLEQIPLFVGVIVAILGSAWCSTPSCPRDSRSRASVGGGSATERNRPGETLMGLGVICHGCRAHRP